MIVFLKQIQNLVLEDFLIRKLLRFSDVLPRLSTCKGLEGIERGKVRNSMERLIASILQLAVAIVTGLDLS